MRRNLIHPLNLLTFVLALVVAAVADDAEEPALKAVVRLGGRYEREANDPGKPVVFISLGNTTATDAVLKEIASIRSVETLSLSCTGITDAGLKELAPFKNLKTLYLGNTNVTDAGLEELAQVKNLEALYIGRSKITDAGLKHLVSLKKLKKVNARGSSATPVGAKMLREVLPDCEVTVDEAREKGR